MSFSRSPKKRLELIYERYPWLKPLHPVINFLPALRYKLVSILQRNWMALQFVALRLRHGKKLVILYRDIGIGDLVCTFPLVAEFKKLYPQELIVYVTHGQFRSFITKFSGADAVIGTNYVLFSQPLPRVPAWVATKSCHPRYVNEGPGSPTGERLGYVLEMAKSCGIAVTDAHPHISVDPAEALSVLQRYDAVPKTRPYIGVHLGPTQPVREWPFASWKKLIELLGQSSDASIFQFGSKWHFSHPSDIKGNLSVHCDLTNRLDLIETTQIISQMDLFIGIDSGLLHIANAAGIPTIGLFGPTNPAYVGSGQLTAGLFVAGLDCLFCQHRGLKLHWNTGCPFDIRCMTELSADVVFAQAKKILESTESLQNTSL